MIHIVDYGLGNIQAFINMYKRLGIQTTLARSAGDLCHVTKLILPGVGAFDHAMELLDASGMRGKLEQLVQSDQIPILGICVGMQILAESSEEGTRPGLGWVKGHVRSFELGPASSAFPMPHMGWNEIVPCAAPDLFRGITEGARFYFLHSYYFDCSDPKNIAARTDYGFQFDCAVQNNHIYGVQFHPEKSHHWGTTLLRNFAEI